MSYSTKNPIELKDAILRRLGAPIINIEVTTEQVYDCIQRALELFGEYHYDGFHKTYATVQVDDQLKATGVIDMRGKNVFAVTQILRANAGSLITMDGTAVYPWFNDFIMGLTGSSIGGQCQWYGPNAFGGDLGYFSNLMSYRSTMMDMLNPLYDFVYNSTTEQLKVVGDYKVGDLLIFEVYAKAYASVDNMLAGEVAGYGFSFCGEDEPTSGQLYENPNRAGNVTYAGQTGGRREQGAYDNRWVKDMATAFVKELNGQVLARHQGMQLPGGTTVDGIRLIEEARIDIANLREELELLDGPPPVIMV